ncbi:MAG: hypothetical protein QM767_02585 [Anaeromyxobacter sp.]
MTPSAPGRQPKPEREAELERQLEELRRENRKLQTRAEMIDRIFRSDEPGGAYPGADLAAQEEPPGRWR